MADFELNFKMDNAAFADGQRDEVARILREIASKVGNGHDDGIVRDYNGNKVGTWSMDVIESEDDEDEGEDE